MQRRTTLLFLVCCCVIVATVAGCASPLNTATNSASNAAASGTGNAGSATTAVKALRYRVTIGNGTVLAEVADTAAQQETGLMYRTSLNEDAGMLFIFQTQEQQSFWMKNMRFPLDIIFITGDKHVLDIYASVPPCPGDPCPLYTSSGPIKYVLEVNAGFSARNGITNGDPVTIVPAN